MFVFCQVAPFAGGSAYRVHGLEPARVEIRGLGKSKAHANPDKTHGARGRLSDINGRGNVICEQQTSAAPDASRLKSLEGMLLPTAWQTATCARSVQKPARSIGVAW
ncbi:hypothetical protein C0Z16_12325 [Paraburkholderia rhynchosiae]|uniref:Uncharacterized protein n=1 Tax=Paraburkholderia rhynchosiae TaxID=487049 RepID=A0ABX4V6A5_9BURK|nr:hypothetical protein C0Z16_12325 [Paraburkholderia rhynchosiae]